MDLTAPPFDRWRAALASKISYAATQPLGTDMRGAGVEAFRYRSARAPRGTNVGLFTPGGFSVREPRALQTWRSIAERTQVEFSKRDYFERAHYRFERGAFLVRGALPHPALPG